MLLFFTHVMVTHTECGLPLAHLLGGEKLQGHEASMFPTSAKEPRAA